jgi:hypothetical protein
VAHIHKRGDVNVRSNETRILHRSKNNINVSSTVFWSVTRCSLVKVRWRFRLFCRRLIHSYTFTLLDNVLFRNVGELLQEYTASYPQKALLFTVTAITSSYPTRDMSFVRILATRKRNEREREIGWHHWDNKKVQFIIAFPLPRPSLIVLLEIATTLWWLTLDTGRDRGVPPLFPRLHVWERLILSSLWGTRFFNWTL